MFIAVSYISTGIFNTVYKDSSRITVIESGLEWQSFAWLVDANRETMCKRFSVHFDKVNQVCNRDLSMTTPLRLDTP
jgi:hypothetical protein